MNKQECDIVKDLSVGYTEKLLSQNSKKFVEEHLEQCNECREYYNAMNTNFLENDNDEERKDKIEINYLKKIKKHINILKIILFMILIIILIIVVFVVIKKYYITNIINQSSNKIESLKQLDNYKFTKRTINKDYLENENSFDVTFSYYYKDGKYKIEYGTESTRYLEDNSYNKICVYDDLKQIEYYTQDFIEIKKGDLIDVFETNINYDSSEILSLSVRKEKFQDNECYVIRKGNSNSYKETWIDCNSWLVTRVISEEKSKYYTEEIFTFSEGITSDADVDESILNTESYQGYQQVNITNNANTETKLYNELLDKKYY